MVTSDIMCICVCFSTCQEDAEAAGKFISDSLARVTMTTDTLSAVKRADLVIEAIVENLAVKQKLFKAIDEVSVQDTYA